MENLRNELSRSELLAPVSFVDGGLLSREAQVLGPGLVEGVRQGIGKSFVDLRQFEQSLWVDPLGTLGTFAQNHWSEAAVGAAITFISPKKWANTLLLAASMRGVATATYEGMMLAANPRNDLDAVRNRYVGHLAEETHALVNGLPMTVAGGALGRIGANTVFGKGKGAWDLASKDVTLADVKVNLWKLHDQILPPKARLAVFDLDSTLVSTGKHMALGIEQASKHLSLTTGLSQETVTAALGEQFGKLQSFTHPWTVELALAEKLNVGKSGGMSFNDFKTQVADPYWKILQDTMPENLKVYEGVHSTLAELGRQKIPAVILTNSPAATALGRINATGLEPHVRAIFALKHLPPPPQGVLPVELIQHGAQRLASWLEPPSTKLRQIPRELHKPEPDVLESIIIRNRLRPNTVMMIGDSLKDDMGVAAKTGARGIWARYAELDTVYDAMLNKVTGGNYTLGKPTTSPHFEAQVHSFSDVLNHLRPPRDLRGYAGSIAGLPSLILPLETYGLIPERKK